MYQKYGCKSVEWAHVLVVEAKVLKIGNLLAMAAMSTSTNVKIIDMYSFVVEPKKKCVN